MPEITDVSTHAISQIIGVYDALSARIADTYGFDWLHVGGYNISGSAHGMPDVGLLTLTENLDAVRRIVGCTQRPVLVDGDDGYGGVDHMLRVKLLRDAVQLQVDAHSRDADHPLRQKPERPADPVSGAYRLNEFLPLEKVTMLPEGTWREVQLMFRGESVLITVDKTTWHQELKRPGFNAAKRKLLWMQNGGEQGIELDDIRVAPTSDAP